MLRLVTSPAVLHQFVRKDDFARDDIAHVLGLDHWIYPEHRSFDPRAVRKELFQLLEEQHRAWADRTLPALLEENVQQLATLLGLNEVDKCILAFAICLHNDALLDDTADMLGPLSTPQATQTVALVLQLPEAQVRQSLGSQGTLARSGLLVVDRTGASRLKSKLEVLSHTFADQMESGRADPIALLRGKIQFAATGHLSLADYGHVQSTLNIMCSWLRYSQAMQRRGVNVYLYGAPGTGKTELARALARELGCELFEVATEDEDGDPISGTQRLRALRAAQSFLARRKALLLFDEVEDVFSDGPQERGAAQSRKGWLNRTLEDNLVPTLWLSNTVHGMDAAFIRRFDMVFELPVPPRSQRARIVQAHCGDLLDAPRLARVVGAEDLTPAVVARAASIAHALGPVIGRADSADAFEHLVSHTLQAQGHRPLPRQQYVHNSDTYDLAFLNADADMAELTHGLRAASGAGGVRLCLYGAPGTGKTAFGRWMAEQLDLPLMVRRASDLLSMYVGEAEKNIARAFREAQDDGALLLIDEVDSFLQDRRGAHRSWEVTQVNEMLTQMEDFPGVFIASTNLMSGLDPAALRRFDLKVKLDYLKPEQSWALLLQHCRRLQLPTPAAGLRARLSRLRQLTPGDFAVVLRSQRFRTLADAEALVASLERECTLKEDANNVIGFL